MPRVNKYREQIYAFLTAKQYEKHRSQEKYKNTLIEYLNIWCEKNAWKSELTPNQPRIGVGKEPLFMSVWSRVDVSDANGVRRVPLIECVKDPIAREVFNDFFEKYYARDLIHYVEKGRLDTVSKILAKKTDLSVRYTYKNGYGEDFSIGVWDVIDKEKYPELYKYLLCMHLKCRAEKVAKNVKNVDVKVLENMVCTLSALARADKPIAHKEPCLSAPKHPTLIARAHGILTQCQKAFRLGRSRAEEKQ